MEKNHRHQDDRWIFGAIFLTALGLRLLLLDRFPLREYESRHAYQAWELWKGLPSSAGPRTLYLAVTEFLFSLFGSSEFTARLWPALGGALLIWVPYGFRRELGKGPALIWAAGLTLDPGLLTGSRFAASPLPAVTWILGGLLLLRAGNLGWGLFTLGLAVLSGPPVWLGLLVLWVGLAFSHWFGPGDFLEDLRRELGDLREEFLAREDRFLLLGLPLIGLLLVSSFGIRNLSGVTAWFSGLADFLGAIRSGSSVPVGRMLFALAAYQPLAFLLGGAEIVRAWVKGDQRGQLLSLWCAAALLVVVINPGRQVVDLAWVLVPLYGLVGLLLYRSFRTPGKLPVVSYLLSFFSLVMLSLSWLSFTGMIAQAANTRAVLLQAVIIAAALLMIGIVVFIAAAEWDWSTARNGLLLGIGGGLLLYTLSAGAGSAYLRMNDPREFWVPGPGTEDLALLEKTLQEVSLSVTGRRKSIEGTVYTEGDLLQWHFRDYPELSFFREYREDLRPQVFMIDQRRVKQITTQAYLGQDFLVSTSPGWVGALPSPWRHWLAFREGLLEEHRVVLWVRRDVLPGGDLLFSPNEGSGDSAEELP
jgi:hypothetical protein